MRLLLFSVALGAVLGLIASGVTLHLLGFVRLR
jgi:hypothetical protein